MKAKLLIMFVAAISFALSGIVIYQFDTSFHSYTALWFSWVSLGSIFYIAFVVILYKLNVVRIGGISPDH